MSLMKEENDYSINVKEDSENPWNIQSLYDLQYFNCPSCSYKNNLKQEFIDHALNFHPESSQYLNNISDGSMTDVQIPNNGTKIIDFKSENNFSHGGWEIKVEESEETTNNQNPENDTDYSYTQFEKVGLSQKDLNFHYTSEYEDFKVFNKSSNGRKDFKCESCEKSFSEGQTLRRHIRRIHEGHKDYECESCGKSFSAGHALKKHIYTIHEGHKDYKCDYCGKAFPESAHLKKHMRQTHEGHKDFKCDSCDKAFTQAHSLRRHILTYHEGRKDFKCEFCGKLFTGAAYMKKHVRLNLCGGNKNLTKMTQVAERIKCEKCNKVFSIDYYNRKHILKSCQPKSDKDLPCQCHVCGKELPNKIKLRRHVSYEHVQSAEKHVCKICGKIFNSRPSIKYHVRHVHEKGAIRILRYAPEGGRGSAKT